MSQATAPLLRKSTPVLAVDRIAPALSFWALLGLDVTVSVPEDPANPDSPLGFVILAGQGLELMYQSVASIQGDLVAAAADRSAFRSGPQQGYLFVEVADLAAVVTRLAGETEVMPERTTFYGATERAYSDRAGNIVVFAQMGEPG